MATFCGCSSGFKYQKFTSKDPALNVSFEYPASWGAEESRGARGTYSAVALMEPVAQKGRFRAQIAVSSFDAVKLPVGAASSRGYADDYIAKRMKFPQAVVERKPAAAVAGNQAEVFEISYKAKENLYGPDPSYAMHRERVVVFRKGSRVYTAVYESGEKDFKKFEPAFEHLLATLKLGS